MPFWMIVLTCLTFIVICWSGGWGIYRGVPGYGPFGGGLLAVLGFVWLVILIVMFVVDPATTTTLPRR